MTPQLHILALSNYFLKLIGSNIYIYFFFMYIRNTVYLSDTGLFSVSIIMLQADVQAHQFCAFVKE